jgi:methionyl-tRNA formyltransferase
MGSDPIALPMLRHLRANRKSDLRIEAVFTQPDRKAGRGMKLQANAIKTWAIDNGIAVHQPRKCGEAETALLKQLGIDLVLVMAYGQILPRHLLEAPPRGALNFHASLLPRLRGASPIHTAVAIGLEETGVSLMRIVPKLDAGPVADVERVPIGAEDTAPDIHARLGQACVPLIDRCLPRIADESIQFTEQDSARVTYCRIIEKTDRCLDFNSSAQVLANRVRAFVPWPGTAFPVDDVEIRILAARAVDHSGDEVPGTLLADADGVRICCAEGALELIQLQRPGGKPLPTDAFVHGFPLTSGRVVESREMRPLESREPFPYRRRRNSDSGRT